LFSGGKGIPERWKWCPGVVETYSRAVEMVCLSGGNGVPERWKTGTFVFFVGTSLSFPGTNGFIVGTFLFFPGTFGLFGDFFASESRPYCRATSKSP
jgi:hypothetical protein